VDEKESKLGKVVLEEMGLEEEEGVQLVGLLEY